MVDNNRNFDEDESLGRVWKEFGKQTEAGKLLYDLYGVRYRPEKFVNYPKLKIKSKEEKLFELEQKEKYNKERAKSGAKLKNASQKIQYPDLNEFKNKNRFKYHKVDLIPHRRKENVIKQELEEIKSAMINKVNTNRPNPMANRKIQIESLQDKFLFQERTVMPKGARLPGLKMKNKEDGDDKNKISYMNNTNETEEMTSNKKIKFSNKKEELMYLHTQIMKEIDERYVFMEEMKKLGKNLDLIIMGEIKDRLDELKKIKKMLDE
jgi:hypothetical protein